MKVTLPLYLKTLLRRIDLFNLGVSSMLVLCAMFLVPPILMSLRIGPDAVAGVAKYVSLRSVLYSALGIAAFAAGYWLWARPVSRGVITPNEGTLWNERRVFWVCLASFALGFAVKIYHVVDGSYQSYMYASTDSPLSVFKFFISLNLLHYIALALAFTHYYALLARGDDRSRRWGAISWSLFGFYLLCGLLAPDGILGTLAPILIHLVTRQYLYEKSNARIMLAAVVVLALIFPLKNITRDMANLTSYAGNELIVDTRLPWNGRDVLDLALNGARGENPVKAGHIMEPLLENSGRLIADTALGRIGQAHIFGIIVDRYRDRDFLQGRTIPFFLTWLWVPREVVERVMGASGTDYFALESGLVNDFLTGVGWTNLGDWYQNFGLTGVIGGMMLIGFAFRFIHRRLTVNASVAGIFAYSLLWITLMHGSEQSLAAALGESLRLIVILYGFCWLLDTKRKTSTNAFPLHSDTLLTAGPRPITKLHQYAHRTRSADARKYTANRQP